LEEENTPVTRSESKINHSITDNVVTASEIVDFIQIFDLKKASGPDKISHKMLKIAQKKFQNHFKLSLANLYKASILQAGKLHT
jgi:hypothetical protein